MVGVALYMQNRPLEAVEQLNKAVETYGKLQNPSATNKYYAAKAEFTIAEIDHEDFNKINLELPESVYKNQIKAKSKLLQDALKYYSHVMGYGISEWTTRSLFQIGQAYEDFAIGIFKQQRPINSAVEQQLALEFGIAKAIEEYFVDKALQFHEKNVKLGIQESIEDKYVLESRKKLTYLPNKAGSNYLALADIAQGAGSDEQLSGLALIAKKLQILQKIAPFQERAIALFLKCLEMGSRYQQFLHSPPISAKRKRRNSKPGSRNWG
jgi:predicted ATPase